MAIRHACMLRVSWPLEDIIYILFALCFLVRLVFAFLLNTYMVFLKTGISFWCVSLCFGEVCWLVCFLSAQYASCEPVGAGCCVYDWNTGSASWPEPWPVSETRSQTTSSRLSPPRLWTGWDSRSSIAAVWSHTQTHKQKRKWNILSNLISVIP